MVAATGEDEQRVSAIAGGWALSARGCDYCKSAPARLFCRVDSAFLCTSCDSKVHGANHLDSRHERVWMCEVCEQAPAGVTCRADAASLCFACDSDIHSANPLSRRHERVPVTPFFEIPSVRPSVAGLLVPNGLLKPSDEDEEEEKNAEMESHRQSYGSVPRDGAEVQEAAAVSWLLCNPNPKLSDGPGFKTGDCFSDMDPFLDLDHGLDGRLHQHGSTVADSVVPVQAESVPRSPILRPSVENFVDFDFCRPKPAFCYNQSVSSSSSFDVGVVPDVNVNADMVNPFVPGIKSYTGGIELPACEKPNPSVAAATQLFGLDREARVLRYREKRKNRKFEKTIRYASRKAYAEMRPRIKGRFVKRIEIEAEVDDPFSIGDPLVSDAGGYGVVPSL